MARKKGFDYFAAFEKMAEYAEQAALYLEKVLKDGIHSEEELLAQVNAIHEIEHNADEVRHEVIRRLTTEFMTPIEREDIIEVIGQSDNVVDQIDEILRTIYMLNAKNLPEVLIEFTGLIVKGTQGLREMMAEFPKFRKSATIKDSIIKVNTIEEEGDLLHLESIHKLFTSDMDPVEIMRVRALIDDMENCLDACEDVSDAVEMVILKNS